MTAAFSQRDEAAKHAARLRSLAEQVARPAVAGRDGGKSLKAKHRNDWRRITDVVVKDSGGSLSGMAAEGLARRWQGDCRSVGIGIGWFANWVFWNWAFPMLLELAKRWLESNKNQQESDSGR